MQNLHVLFFIAKNKISFIIKNETKYYKATEEQMKTLDMTGLQMGGGGLSEPGHNPGTAF